MINKANVPFYICLLLLAFSLLVLGVDALRWKTVSEEEMRGFQNLAGGLGMGAVVAPAWSIIDFDPRLQAIDESTLRPFPGGYSYSPAGTSSVSCFKEIPIKGEDQ
jgi:hypothetical protein